MKKVALIFFLLFLPVVSAEDFNVYNNLVINNVITGYINVKESGSNPYLEYIKANLMLFPKKNFQQSVLEQSVTSNPESDSFSVNEEVILLEWSRISGDKISFKIDTTLEVKNDFPKVSKTVSFPISNLDPALEEYTHETSHIDITPEIKAKANELASGETDLFIATYKIGEWVNNNVKYDLNTLTAEADQKASWVFINKRGVCDEITNLFLAMLRSVNIPSRFVSGVVYSNLEDNFGNHGWAEVYLPGSGWVPFDITFGQYGWVDATHVKMDDTYDSGIPSVEYNWKSRDMDIKAESLEFKTTIEQKNGKVSSPVEIEIKPLKEKVSFGSYVPIEITVKNLNNYYLPLALYIIKAPDLVEEKNWDSLVLKPNEKKHLYWTVKIPSNLEEEYIYTSDLEVRTVFGDTASNIIKYAKSFEYYSEEWARTTLDQLSERENKFFFKDIGLDCSSDKQSYYSTEDASIKCSVVNTGNIQLEDINVCIAEDCRKFSLGIGEKNTINFIKPLTKSEVITISAENEDMVQYEEVKIDVIEIPDLQIVEVKPETIGYHESGVLIMSLVTESPAYNVELVVEDLGIAEWESLVDKNFLKIPFEGKDFSEGYIDVTLSYNDALNKTYTQEREIPILVTDLPFYVKVLNLFKNLF